MIFFNFLYSALGSIFATEFFFLFLFVFFLLCFHTPGPRQNKCEQKYNQVNGERETEEMYKEL